VEIAANSFDGHPPGISAGTLRINQGLVTFSSETNRAFVDQANGVTVAGAVSLLASGDYFVQSGKDNFEQLPAIHLASIPPNASFRYTTVAIKKTGGDWEISDTIAPGQLGWLCSVPSDGDYEVRLNMQLHCHDGGSKFTVKGGEAFFAETLHPCSPDADVGLIVELVLGVVVIVAAVVVGVILYKKGFWSCATSQEKKKELLAQGESSYDPNNLL
jgi:hypothetical protein